MITSEPISLPLVAGDNLMTTLGRSLGISGDPQGFFLYLLIMIGIFVIISILIYNWLEERRFNKQVESNFSSIEEDALLNDKQQKFFDKFASTTGVLNDKPADGTFIDEDGYPVEDDRSVEDVYAELLETMSRRDRKNKVEPDVVTIDHDQVRVSDPIFDMSSDPLDIGKSDEDVLYIPEPVLSDAQSVSTTKLSFEAEQDDVVIRFEDVEESSTSHSNAEKQVEAQSLIDEHVSASATPSEPLPETYKGSSQQDIREIISRAFKEKYNPNFKAENAASETVAETVSAPVNIDDVSEKSSNTSALDESDEIVQESAENEDFPILDLQVEEDMGEIESSIAVDEAEPLPELATEAPQILTKEDLPPIVTEEVSTDETEKDTSTNIHEDDFRFTISEEENVDDAFKLDFEALNESSIDDAESAFIADEIPPEPTVDIPNFATTIPVGKPENTYQQLLNEDKTLRAVQNDEPKTQETASKQDDIAEEPSQNSQAEQNADNPSDPIFSDAIPELLNPHIDIIGTIEATKGSNAAFILESFATFHQQFELPVFVFMQCQQSHWLFLNGAAESDINRYLERYKPVHITASIQMADRSGPISRNTVQRFQQALSEVAVTMGATVKWRDASEPVDRAASLDAFCIEVDKTMFFHLANTKTPFTGTKLKGLVESQGMVLETDGAYKYYDLNTHNGMKRSVPDFILFNRDNHRFTEEMLRSSVIKAITMQLDIPVVTTDATALDRMVVIAQSLESSLNAQLVDDKNRPITDVHLARIRDQIKSIHAAMQLRGITPGSTHAQRLFS